MELAERESRGSLAEDVAHRLRAQGVVAVATTFVDNAGITRVKAVPLDRLPRLAAWGVGSSTTFDYFRLDDWIAAPAGGHAVVGDLRILPDVRRVVPLVAQPGWAWAPGDRYRQDGKPHEQCSRMLLRRQAIALADQGIAVKASFEIEWMLSRLDTDDFVPAASGTGCGMSRLVRLSGYSRDLIDALGAEGISVDQFHPEYGAGQLEISVAAESPIEAADTSVLVRTTIRAVGEHHGFRTSFSPKVDPVEVGNGGHVHLSLWREGRNLMSGGEGPCGLTDTAEAFGAGILARLPALMAIGAPSVASYLRLTPSQSAGVYACWGLENREAAVRMVTGSTGSSAWAANIEVKCFDLTANPYLLLSVLLAAGSAGIAQQARLPDPVDVDPTALSDEILEKRGIRRLPASLRESVDALASDECLRRALGVPLLESVLAVRESEVDLFSVASDQEVVRATRWLH